MFLFRKSVSAMEGNRRTGGMKIDFNPARTGGAPSTRSPGEREKQRSPRSGFQVNQDPFSGGGQEAIEDDADFADFQSAPAPSSGFGPAFAGIDGQTMASGSSLPLDLFGEPSHTIMPISSLSPPQAFSSNFAQPSSVTAHFQQFPDLFMDHPTQSGGPGPYDPNASANPSYAFRPAAAPVYGSSSQQQAIQNVSSSAPYAQAPQHRPFASQQGRPSQPPRTQSSNAQGLDVWASNPTLVSLDSLGRTETPKSKPTESLATIRNHKRGLSNPLTNEQSPANINPYPDLL